MYTFPFCTRVACVLAERSRSAAQVLGFRSAHGRHSRLRAPPPWSHPQVRPAPAPGPAPRSLLAVWNIFKRFSPSLDGRPRVDPGGGLD
eukprot:2368599-Pleurochrysis_carterae.AAC.1